MALGAVRVWSVDPHEVSSGKPLWPHKSSVGNANENFMSALQEQGQISSENLFSRIKSAGIDGDSERVAKTNCHTDMTLLH
jgi:hypothetical protein